MGTLSFDIDGIERSASGHKEPIAFSAAETNVAANFWKDDLANAIAVGSEDMHPVITIANPTRAGPDITILISANAVGDSTNGFPVEFHFHGGKCPAFVQL